MRTKSLAADSELSITEELLELGVDVTELTGAEKSESATGVGIVRPSESMVLEILVSQKLDGNLGILTLSPQLDKILETLGNNSIIDMRLLLRVIRNQRSHSRSILSPGIRSHEHSRCIIPVIPGWVDDVAARQIRARYTAES